MTKLPDHDARMTATTMFANNIVVSAGAGTGKTSLLVERVLNLVGSGHCELERLAAITFTEKAAAELRFRVAEGLEQLRAVAAGECDPDAKEPSGRSYAWLAGDTGIEGATIADRALLALQQIDRARLLTIHAFCAELLRLFPVEARVDPDFRVDTGEQAELFYRTHWEQFVQHELGAEGRRHELWNRTLDVFGVKQLAEAARLLADWAVPLDALSPAAVTGGIGLLAGLAEQSVNEIDELVKRATGITSRQTLWFDNVRRCLDALANGNEVGLEALIEDPAVRKDLDYGKLKPGRRLAGVTPAEFSRVADRARQLCRQLPARDDARFADLVETLLPFVTSFREEFTRRGFVSFDGLLALARDLLRDHPRVREQLKRRFDTLLVDEFQDTNPLQYEIVLMLGEKPGTCGGDPWNLELEPGRLFVVGDPKQSIYRFRGADYDAFRRAVETIGDAGATHLTLHANFRSVPGIVDPVNTLFEKATTTCWRANATQPVYEPIAAARADGANDPDVEIWTIDGDRSDKIDKRRRVEGRLIADEVERLHAGGVKYGEISILFRTFASIPTYLRPLRERNIPFVVDGGKDFIKRPEIKQSLAVLRTLAQPSDATALLAFLRSPAGGVSDAELATWAAAGRRWDWRYESGGAAAELCPRIGRCFSLLRQLNDDTRQLPPDAAVRTIVERVQLLPLAAAAYEGAQRVANLHKLIAAASTLTRDGHLSLEDLVDEIEEGGLADLEAESPLSDDDTDAVRITSIHKMKGLENDWVLLPDLARQRVNPRAFGMRFAVLRDDDGTPRLAAQYGKYVVNSAWIRHHLAHLEHEESEETRVLYVALTRARKRLVLVSSPGEKNSTRWYDALAGWGYDPNVVPEKATMLVDGRVLHRRMQPPAALSSKDFKAPERETAAVTVYDEARDRLHREASPPFRAPSAAGHESEESRLAPQGAGRDVALAAGRVIHAALEFWDGADGDALETAAGRLVRSEIEHGDIDDARLQTEIDTMVSGLRDGELGRTFAGLEIVARELSLLLRDEDGTGWRGSIDLVYRENSRVVIADYKTDREDGEALLVERYSGQLGVYARALQRAMDLDALPRTELWLLRHDRRLVVPARTTSPGPAEPVKQPKRTKPDQQSLF